MKRAILLAFLAVAPAHAALLAYVANALDGTVSVVDVRTGRTRATVPVGCDPRVVVAHPDGTRVYVANSCADGDPVPGSVSVLDTATDAVVASIPVPFGPVGLAVDASRNRLYAACLAEIPFSDEDPSGLLYVADLATGAPIDQLDLFLVPHDLVLARDGRHAFVSGVVGARDDEGNIHVTFSGVVATDVDGRHDGPIYRGGSGPLALDRTGRTLFVVDEATNELAVVDTATATERARVPVGIAAQDVLFDPTRSRVLVASTGDSPNTLPDVVTVVDGRSDTVAATFDAGWAPSGLALARRSSLLLVTNFYSGTLRVQRTRTGALLRTIPVGLGASAVAVVRAP